MTKKLNVYHLGIGVLLLPLVAFAETPEKSTEMTRDAWLEAVKMGVSEPVCKSFMSDESIASQMSTRHISYDKCVSLMPTIAERCEKKYFSELPMIINDQNAEKWGRTLGECIGNEFALGYLSADEDVTVNEGE